MAANDSNQRLNYSSVTDTRLEHDGHRQGAYLCTLLIGSGKVPLGNGTSNQHGADASNELYGPEQAIEVEESNDPGERIVAFKVLRKKSAVGLLSIVTAETSDVGAS